MNWIKTDKEVEIMKKSGRICAEALKEVLKNVRPGITCKQLDQIAYQKIKELGGQSSFMTVDSYKWTICTTINEQVVHGIPTNQELMEGDILGIDIGALYQGYHSDQAISVPVGNITKEQEKFLAVGRETLEKAISQVKLGNRIGDVSHTIQTGIEKAGYSVVKSLTGHGVGKSLHEDPMVPCFGKAGKGPLIEKNMTLAIEVIYTQGSGDVILEDDNWTISSSDGSLGGLYEQTIVVTDDDPIIMTPYL